jgi:hypothetical protein
MMLLTKSIAAKLPPINESYNLKNPMVWIKFFCPWSNWTWYGIGYDPEDRIFFGYVEGFENEVGDFSLTELEEITGPLGMKIERDLYFEPKRLSEVRKAA